MNWHQRYLEQASWTRHLRDYLFDKTELSRAGRVLEVGCGTGAILSTLQTSAIFHGLDLEASALSEAKLHAADACLTRGDAHCLPYPNHSFDITYFHYFLLWARQPLKALLEMKRVTRTNGYVLALAEPDYTHRTDKPGSLKALGLLQNESLQRQGADIGLGAHLADLFFQAGIKIIETGAIRSRRGAASASEKWGSEWAVLESDLSGSLPSHEIMRWKKLNQNAYSSGELLLNVPTYFAWGQV